MRRASRSTHCAPVVTLSDRVLSAYHGLWLWVSEGIGRVRGARPEQPAGTLPLDAVSEARIAVLRTRYGVAFESHQNALTALENYARLDLLDQAYRAWGRLPPERRVMHDVGCASFFYAGVLHAVFRPSALSGFELEGYRRLQGGLNRAERALAYVREWPATEFVVADYTKIHRPAGVITAFFPFVTPQPVLAWRLPLRVLAPERLFARVRANLAPEGEFLMVNHGEAEAAIAAAYAHAAGLECQQRHIETASLAPRAQRAVVSRYVHPPDDRPKA
jgi:hypothetical protein